MITIYGRATWGARYDDGLGPAPLPASELWLHHSVTAAPPQDATFDEDAAAVRVLEQIGQSRFVAGISYTFVIPPSGRVFAGHSVGREGAHTYGHNRTGRGICLLGNYDAARPTDPQLTAVAALLAHGHAAGWWKTPALTGGHRDLKATACPGRHAYALIPVINSRALAPQQEDSMLTPAELIQTRDGVWQAPIDDVLTPGQTLQAWQHLQWASGNAATARLAAERAADQAVATLAAVGAMRAGLVAELGEVKAALVKIATGGVDYQVLAAALADELLGRLAGAGEAGQ